MSSELMSVIDYSRWQGTVSLASHRAMKAAGIEAVVVGLWHGIDANPYALNSLANAKQAGLLIGGYIVVVSRDAREVVRAGKAAAGAHWNDMFGVAIDVEIRGITEVNLANAMDEVVRQGNRPFLYTGNWFWGWWMLELGHAPRGAEKYGAWLAVYNGIKTLESAGTRPGYGPVIGHQYAGSTPAFGTTVDFNVFDREWLLETQPEPQPEPEPPEEEIMGKIADQFAALGRNVEAEIAAKAGATGPRGPEGPKGDTGPMGPPGPGGTAQRTYTVKAGDSLGSIANQYSGVTWQQIYEANKGLIGGNPNLIQPGMVLVIP